MKTQPVVRGELATLIPIFPHKGELPKRFQPPLDSRGSWPIHRALVLLLKPSPDGVSGREKYFTQIHGIHLPEIIQIFIDGKAFNLAEHLLKKVGITIEQITDSINYLATTHLKFTLKQNKEIQQKDSILSPITNFRQEFASSLLHTNDDLQELQSLARVHIVLELDPLRTGAGDLDDAVCTQIGILASLHGEKRQSVFVVHDELLHAQDLREPIMTAAQEALRNEETALIISARAADIPHNPSTYLEFIKDLNLLLQGIEKQMHIPIRLIWNEVDHHADPEGKFGTFQRCLEVSKRPGNIAWLVNNHRSPAAALDTALLWLAPIAPRISPFHHALGQISAAIADDIGQGTMGNIPEGASPELLMNFANDCPTFREISKWIQLIPPLAGLFGTASSEVNVRVFQESLVHKVHMQTHTTRRENDLPLYALLSSNGNHAPPLLVGKGQISGGDVSRLLDARAEFLRLLEKDLLNCPVIQREAFNHETQLPEIIRIIQINPNAGLNSVERLRRVVDTDGLSPNTMGRVIATHFENMLFVSPEDPLSLLIGVINTSYVGIPIHQQVHRVVARNCPIGNRKLNAALAPLIFNPLQHSEGGYTVGGKDGLAAGFFRATDMNWWQNLEKQIDEILAMQQLIKCC